MASDDWDLDDLDNELADWEADLAAGEEVDGGQATRMPDYDPQPPDPTLPAPLEQQSMSEETWLNHLAYEVALSYFAPEELQAQFDVDVDQFEQITQQKPFQRKVLAYRKAINDDGTLYRLKAKRMSELALDVVGEIVFNQLEKTDDRLKAIGMIQEAAGRTAKTAGDGDGGPKLIIQTNLNLGSTEEQGVYTVEVPQTGVEHQG